MTAAPLALLVLAAAGAAGPDLDGSPLTEDRAVALALEASPSLRALRDRLEESRALVDVATELKNPELRVSNLRSDRLVAPAIEDRPYGDYPFEHASIGVRWSPPNLGARAEERAEAERRVDQADAELEEARRALVARVRALHATVIGLDAQLALARDTVAARDRLRTLTRRRLERQAATVLDQSLADVDYLDALSDLEELEAQRRQVFSELLVQVALPSDAVVALAPGEPPACAPPPADPAPVLRRAEELSPRLRSFRAALAEVDAERSRLELERIPWPEFVQVAYVLRGDEEPAYVTLGFSVPLPVLDRNGGELRAVSFRRERLEDEYRAETRALAGRVRRALEDRAEQAAHVQRYRDAAPIVDGGVARVERALEVGETDLLQLAAVETRVLGARRARLRAELECRLTQIELERWVGPLEAGR